MRLSGGGCGEKKTPEPGKAVVALDAVRTSAAEPNKPASQRLAINTYPILWSPSCKFTSKVATKALGRVLLMPV